MEHWRLLNGPDVPFDAEGFRLMEERVVEHAGRHDNTAAHARADQAGLARGTELAGVTIPTLVIEAPNDPINPPPAAAHLSAAIPGARTVTVPAMGHALPFPVLGPVVAAVLAHPGRVDVQR